VGTNRTKMFHVKHFGKVRAENLTYRATRPPLHFVGSPQASVRWRFEAIADLLTSSPSVFPIRLLHHDDFGPIQNHRDDPCS